MGSRSRTIALLALMCSVVGACGDGDHNDNDGGTPGRTPTPAASPARTATVTPATSASPGSPSPGGTPVQRACPTRLTYLVNGTRADLDSGWTGIYSDQSLPVGGSLSFALACPGQFLGGCGTCALSGPIASTTTINNHRCVNASNIECTSDGDCPGSTCAFFFGPQIPVSAGGFPICFTNYVSGAVTGTLSPELGQGTSSLPLTAALFSGLTADRPCPVCSGATLQSTGTCSGGDRNGMPCTVHGTTTTFGNVSFDCPAAAAGNIANFAVPLDLTTGTSEVAASATCTGSGGGSCWCEGQDRRNACDGGVCNVDAAGEGACASGPVDQICTIERFRTCASNAECPASGDTCVLQTRECLGPTDASGAATGPITRTGTPSQATPTLVSVFCLGTTSAPAVNTSAGFPGPSALRLPTVICIEESCPASPPTVP